MYSYTQRVVFSLVGCVGVLVLCALNGAGGLYPTLGDAQDTAHEATYISVYPNIDEDYERIMEAERARSKQLAGSLYDTVSEKELQESRDCMHAHEVLANDCRQIQEVIDEKQAALGVILDTVSFDTDKQLQNNARNLQQEINTLHDQLARLLQQKIV